MQTGKTDYLHPEINKMLQNFTKYMSKPLGFNKMYNEDSKKREMEYATSLPLQIILYFNVYFSIVWIIGTSLLWPVLLSRAQQSDVWIILILFAFIMLVIFEIIRLYLGYLGNLQERVPELTGFWLLTLIIQTPLCVFLLVIVWIPIDANQFQIVYQIPMQFALQLIHFVFVFFEDILGYVSVRVLARYQIARFHYKQFDPSASYGAGGEEKPNDFRQLDWLHNLERMNETAYKVCWILLC